MAPSTINPAIILTLSRVILAPPFAYFFITGMKNQSPLYIWISIIILICIELSDAFDGHIARKNNQVTDFGKLVDPMADSISRQTIFLAFLLSEIIPLWMFLIFLIRDSGMSTLRIMIAKSGTVQAARTSGKLKAIFAAIGTALTMIVCLCQSYSIPGFVYQLWGNHLGFYLLLFPTLFTIFSAFDYIIPNWHIVRSMAKPITNNSYSKK